MQRVSSRPWFVVSDMRQNRVPTRRPRRHPFLAAFSSAAIATGTAAGLGYLIALSALAGWVALGIGGAVALSLWLEARPGRHATPPPTTSVVYLPRQRDGE